MRRLIVLFVLFAAVFAQAQTTTVNVPPKSAPRAITLTWEEWSSGTDMRHEDENLTLQLTVIQLQAQAIGKRKAELKQAQDAFNANIAKKYGVKADEEIQYKKPEGAPEKTDAPKK